MFLLHLLTYAILIRNTLRDVNDISRYNVDRMYGQRFKSCNSMEIPCVNCGVPHKIKVPYKIFY